MMLELCAYGLISGLLYKKFNVYISLIGAMLAGRAVSGIASAVLFGFAGKPYGITAFVTGAFVTAWPGILIQIILIPLLIVVLEKAGIIESKKIQST